MGEGELMLWHLWILLKQGIQLENILTGRLKGKS